ncbi:MAG: hypothetical protein CVU41_09715 [Chloroflexi bacterium HGW-Chloroflexi-3]|nr:MAG: hypothetical protein CVU41_09715 [Chloroflexi bacterium HGW-Chloroflexi-3]
MQEKQKISIEEVWKNWIDCLIGDDRNSIFQQINLMIWDTSIFRVVVACRKKKVEKNSEEPEINGALHSFIDRNYFQSQCLYIRRIIDSSFVIRGKKGVFSLGALLKDLKKYRLELNREKFLFLLGKPYDYSEIQKKENEYLKTHHNCIVPSEYDWWPIEEAHRFFDRLCGINITERRPDDVIPEQVFSRLDDKLSTCKKIIEYVEKNIAHSATQDSREIQNAEDLRITFHQIWDAQKIVFEVANFLSTALFSTGNMALQTENHNFYQYWDKPMFECDEIGLVRSTVKAYRDETSKWSETAIDNIWNWIEETNVEEIEG